MKKAVLSLLITFTSTSMCWSFTSPPQTQISKTSNTILEEGKDHEISSLPPALEKCKKRKK